MKISNLLYMGALSTLTLMSCTNNDDNSEWYGSEGIVFTTAIQSRVSGNTWNANDEVGIYMMNSGSGIEAATAQNKKYIAQTNGTLTAASGNGIYLPESGSVDFIAYYPYTTSVSGNKIAVNVSDQSKPAAIDLIYSNGTKGIEATSATTVDLAFTHQLTKITLNVTKDATVETLSGLGVTMKGISTEGEFNLADGTLAATAGTNNKDVAMYMDVQGTTATATAIIIPTASASEQTAINLTFNLSGQSFTYTIDNTSIFEKGTNVSFDANLSINNGKPVVTVGNATITAWTEKAGGDIDVNFDGEPQPQPGEEAVVLNESFATGQGSFTIDNKQLPNGEGSFVWSHGSYNDDKFMKASAYINDTKYASESWLVSPLVDLSQATTATLTFDHAHNYAGTAEEEFTLWATETSADNWQQLTIDKYGSGFKFTTATIDLSAYAGKTIKFAFKYVSTTAAAGTWEIKNVKVVANGEGGGTVDPEPEPEPGINLLTNPGFEDWTNKLPTAWDNDYNTGEIIKETTIKHSGNNSLRQTSADKATKIQQEVTVTPGKKYRLSYWYLDNDNKARTRCWFAYNSGDPSTGMQPNDYSTDNPEWQQVVVEITVPEGATILRFEARTYRESTTQVGGYIYYDDMEMVEIQ
ncbi:fimbrillin family protein [Phocaeicola plebeius]|uniref:fimbrillin family protein n=1 Tax=Phocaeicola plebeius TaxID=310297 RepID=UPI00195B5430|nr:fimbrillin family protein [Phocaeicola plebeius]MBM6843256.1 fimbrillin family protein [Phocaeicola plebeius]